MVIPCFAYRTLIETKLKAVTCPFMVDPVFIGESVHLRDSEIHFETGIFRKNLLENDNFVIEDLKHQDLLQTHNF